MIDDWLKSNRNFAVAWVLTTLAFCGAVSVYQQAWVGAKKYGGYSDLTVKK